MTGRPKAANIVMLGEMKFALYEREQRYGLSQNRGAILGF
jgi:hypothetical protein